MHGLCFDGVLVKVHTLPPIFREPSLFYCPFYFFYYRWSLLRLQRNCRAFAFPLNPFYSFICNTLQFNSYRLGQILSFYLLYNKLCFRFYAPRVILKIISTLQQYSRPCIKRTYTIIHSRRTSFLWITSSYCLGPKTFLLSKCRYRKHHTIYLISAHLEASLRKSRIRTTGGCRLLLVAEGHGPNKR